MDTPGYMKYINELEKELEVYKALVKELAGDCVELNVVSREDGYLAVKISTSRLTKAVNKLKGRFSEENK